MKNIVSMINTEDLIIVDLEATCWELPQNRPLNQFQEIIEIGVARFSLSSRDITDKASYLVYPEKSEVSNFCTQLTSLTQRQLETEGRSYPEIFSDFIEKFNLPENKWASWGRWDRNQFRVNSKLYNLPDIMRKNHINIKELYKGMFVSKKRKGLTKAMRTFGLEFQGTPHRGIDDAINTARLFNKLLLEKERRTRR